MRVEYDLIVIGTGPAGEKAAAQAAYFGKKVVAIERAPEPGGAGTHTGTVPSKTLREASMYLSGYRSRDMYWHRGGAREDGNAPAPHVAQVRDRGFRIAPHPPQPRPPQRHVHPGRGRLPRHAHRSRFDGTSARA
jgi:pyruvate/2-oxoglutarate dehydrogenase complex dihydrolipoamide dehydrogenase (E3) component